MALLVTTVLLGADCCLKNEPGSLLWAALSPGCSLNNREKEVCSPVCGSSRSRLFPGFLESFDPV